MFPLCDVPFFRNLTTTLNKSIKETFLQKGINVSGRGFGISRLSDWITQLVVFLRNGKEAQTRLS